MTQGWQQQVIDEKVELDLKINKLHTFLGTTAYDNLPEREQDLLEDQFFHMRKYSQILGRRINAFE